MNSASASKLLMGLLAISSAGVAAADPESPGTASPSVETLQKKVEQPVLSLPGPRELADTGP
jgi:hypothetical protein